MKRAFTLPLNQLALLFALMFSFPSFANFVNLTAELIHEHDGVSTAPVPAGFKTYRIYANFDHPDDYLTSVYAFAGNNISITTTTSFYQDPLGGAFAGDTSEEIMELFPMISFDSFLSLGAELDDDVNIITVQSQPMVSLTEQFESGGNVLILDGIWYIPVTMSEFPRAGDDLRVLVAQLTTDGDWEFCGSIQTILQSIPGNSEEVPGQCIDSSQATSAPCPGGNPLFLLASDNEDPTCNGDSNGYIHASADGGTGVYEYSIDGVNFDTEALFEGLAAGSYEVIARDELGCEVVELIELVDPPVLELALDAEPARCFGEASGSVNISSTGGSGGHYYYLNETEYSDEPLFENLNAGIQTIRVEDENGCSTVAEFEIIQPEEIFLSSVDQNVSCFGGNDGHIMATAQGGNGGFVFGLDDAALTASPEFANLEAGTYVLKTEDQLGCVAEKYTPITGPDAIEIAYESFPDGVDLDGAIELTITGGTGDYQIIWTGPEGFTSGEQNIDGLLHGEYMLQITDENGCVYEDVIVISETVGLDELFSNLTVAVMPNPSNGEFVLNIDGMNGERILMTITDGIGRTVVSEQINGSGLVRTDINLNNAADGMYFLNLTVGEASRTIKLIKQ